MAHVVTENCIKCRYTDCVEVCPVDCFHEGANFLVIDPNECIDCGVCRAECPVGAIYPAEEIPAEQYAFVALNATLAQTWPSITRSQKPPVDAARWAGVDGKLALLES